MLSTAVPVHEVTPHGAIPPSRCSTHARLRYEAARGVAACQSVTFPRCGRFHFVDGHLRRLVRMRVVYRAGHTDYVSCSGYGCGEMMAWVGKELASELRHRGIVIDIIFHLARESMLGCTENSVGAVSVVRVDRCLRRGQMLQLSAAERGS